MSLTSLQQVDNCVEWTLGIRKQDGHSNTHIIKVHLIRTTTTTTTVLISSPADTMRCHDNYTTSSAVVVPSTTTKNITHYLNNMTSSLFYVQTV